MKKHFFVAFICAQSILFASFLALDILGEAVPVSAIIKFASIVLCCAYSFMASNDKLLRLAMTATLIADFFLLLYGRFEIGIAVFIVAQTCHAMRFDKEQRIQTLALEAIIAFCALELAGLYKFNLRDSLVVVYAVALVMSCYKAVNALRSGLMPRAVAFRAVVGMGLFVLCDLHVALYNVLPASSPYYGIASVAMWLFYLPSQVLLTTVA